MKQDICKIKHLPAVIWGDASDTVVIAAHGNLSSKTDEPIGLLAQCAQERGWQVLSFDFPEHGDRKEEGTVCLAQTCVAELNIILDYAKTRWEHLMLFANSMGAYFSLLAYQHAPLERAWFLSPVVDMERQIENLMAACDVTPEQLRAAGTIPTPFGQTLIWDYYDYVRANPVTKWPVPTSILCGSADDFSGVTAITDFAWKNGCALAVMDPGEHWFHTPEQLEYYVNWLGETM